MVCKVESFCWKQGQTNGKNNFEHILSLQGAKYVFQTSPKSKFKFALLSAVEQSAHPTWGLDALKASYYSKQSLQGKDGSPPPQRLESEARIRISTLWYFTPQWPEKGLLSPWWHAEWHAIITSPLYILSKSNSYLQQQQFHGAEQSVPKELQEKPVLHAKYEGLINIVYFSWCG